MQCSVIFKKNFWVICDRGKVQYMICFGNLMLTEIGQAQKRKYYTIGLLWGLGESESRWLNVQWWHEGLGEKEGAFLLSGSRMSVLRNVDGYVTMWAHLVLLHFILKMGKEVFVLIQCSFCKKIILITKVFASSFTSVSNSSHFPSNCPLCFLLPQAFIVFHQSYWN